MANPINTTQSPVLLNTALKPSGKSAVGGAGTQAAQSSVTPVQGDKVSMTSEAARLQKIEEQLSAVPAVNSQKVAEIKAAIANGSFTIDPQAIASKLIAYESGQ